VTVAEAIVATAGPLAALGSEARREARRLVALALGSPEVVVLAHPERELDTTITTRLEELCRRRGAGEPYAYLVGRREFYGLDFAVDDRVLIPRPETEHLVEAATAELAEETSGLLVDLGTGSGCIAVALATRCPNLRVLAVDQSVGAAAVAASNARRHGVANRVQVVVGNWADALDLGAAKLVVTNPPYIATADPELEPAVAAWEPAAALFGGADGLEAIRSLLESLHLAGCTAPVWCEIGARQSAALHTAAAGVGWQVVRVDVDLAGLPRLARLVSATSAGKD
jgi:release factor glutamine methyltransferase